MQQRRRDRGTVWHRLSAISETADDPTKSLPRNDGRPQPEGLASELRHQQHRQQQQQQQQRQLEQLEQHDFKPLLDLGLPTSGLVTAVASSRALLLDCASADAPAAAEEVEVRVTTEATGPNPSVALARAAARAAGAASAAVKKSRIVGRQGAAAAEAEYRIFISTSCTLRAPQSEVGSHKLEGARKIEQYRQEEDVVELLQVALPHSESHSWSATEADGVERAYISDSEPGSPTSEVDEYPTPPSQPSEPSALQQARPALPASRQQQRGRAPGPNSFQADQSRLQAARDAYAAVKAAPPRPRASRSLPRLSNAIIRGAGSDIDASNSSAASSNRLRWSNISTSSSGLRQLRRLLDDGEAVSAYPKVTDDFSDQHPQQSRSRQQRARYSATEAPKSASLFDLLSAGRENAAAISADVSHSCASLLETDDQLASDECFQRSLKKLRLPSSRREPDPANTRSAKLFFEWLESRAKSECELNICRSLTRLEAPVWLDNLAMGIAPQAQTATKPEEARRSWRLTAAPMDPKTNSLGATETSRQPSTWKPRSMHGSLSLPMRLSSRAEAQLERQKAGVSNASRNTQSVSIGSDRPDGGFHETVRYFTESSLSQRVRQAAASQPRRQTMSELAARLHRPALLPVTLKPEDFQPRLQSETVEEKTQVTTSSEASGRQKQDSGASMASGASSTSSAASLSTSSNAGSSSATSETGSSSASDDSDTADKGEESTVVQTSIVLTRILHQPTERRKLTDATDTVNSGDPLPGLVLCQPDPTGPPAEADSTTAPKLLRLAEAQLERQQSRLLEWRRDAGAGQPIKASQAELMAAIDKTLGYFQVEDAADAPPRPGSPSLADDDVLQALGEDEASSELARVLVGLGGIGQRKLQLPQRSLAETCQGVVREGRRYLLECANPPCAQRCELGQRLGTGFRSCWECRTYYCSRKCRSDHTGAHVRSCGRTRRVDACKRIIAGCLLNPESKAAALLSSLARSSARCLGWRGCILLALRHFAAAQRFVTTDGAAGLQQPPALLDLASLSGDLANACKANDPEATFVVCVVVKDGVKWAQLRLQASLAEDDLSLDAGLDAERRRRSTYVARVERLLRERGVSLRRQFPQLRDRLAVFAETGVPFQPAVIYPTDQATGRAFTCRLAPDREPEFDWVLPAVAVIAEDPAGPTEAAAPVAPRQPPFYRRRPVVSTDL